MSRGSVDILRAFAAAIVKDVSHAPFSSLLPAHLPGGDGLQPASRTLTDRGAHPMVPVYSIASIERPLCRRWTGEFGESRVASRARSALICAHRGRVKREERRDK